MNPQFCRKDEGEKMAFDWFDAHNAEVFGETLAQFFLKYIPVTTERLNDKAFAKQIEVVDKMNLQIEQFKLANKLNIYKKAKLGNAFREKLISAGHKPAFVDQITKGLLYKL
jgi:hypothetical protein